MAKVTAPLLSFGASGQIAGTQVYFPWKGINAVRKYVVPSNPNTIPQQTQRGLFSEAAAAIHVAQAMAANPLNATDQTAYSLLSRILGITMTWWNTIIKLWVDVSRLEFTPVIYRDVNCLSTNHDHATMIGYLSEETPEDLVEGKIWLGTSPSNLNISSVCVITVGVSFTNNAAAFTTLTAGVKYFYQFRPDADDLCEGAVSGIYSFTAD